MTLRSTLFAGTLAALALACASTDPGQVAPVDFANDDEKVIYTIGQNVAAEARKFQLTAEELAVFQAGIRDGVLGLEPQVDLAEHKKSIRKLTLARVRARAELEKEASQSFLDAAAAEEGAQTLPSGLIIKVLEPGEGPSPTGRDAVKVHYTGKLRDGTIFDSSYSRGDEPRVVRVSGVIPCWTEALQAMNVGMKARFTCPSDIAYGDTGSLPTIQPGEAIAFEVELIEIVKR